jgi:hypothetical protein
VTPAFAIAAWVATAADFYLEAGPYTTRAEASAAADSLKGDRSVRVVRRFRSGAGWEFIVRVGGFDDEDAMRSYAGKSSAFHFASFERVGTSWRRLDGAPPDAAPTENELVDVPGQTLRTPALLRAAVKAHGGREGGVSILELAPTVVFDYERTVAREGGRTVAEHHYTRMGDAVRLDIDVTKGTGVDSSTILAPDRRAWVSTDATSIARDPERTAEVLARFSPEGLLAVPLGIPHDMETAGPWRLLAPTARIDGKRVIARAEAPGDRGLLSAEFGLDDHRLRRLDWMLDTGPITYVFDDYRTIGEGLVVPFRYEVLRDGAVIESMKVDRLELGNALPADTFAIPDATTHRP